MTISFLFRRLGSQRRTSTARQVSRRTLLLFRRLYRGFISCGPIVLLSSEPIVLLVQKAINFPDEFEQPLAVLLHGSLLAKLFPTFSFFTDHNVRGTAETSLGRKIHQFRLPWPARGIPEVYQNHGTIKKVRFVRVFGGRDRVRTGDPLQTLRCGC